MCVFCEIIKGNIPSSKVYEDDEVIAILDLSQTTKGHTIVMPKKHYANMLEIPADEFGSIMAKAKNIAQTLVTKLNAKGCNILINTNEAAGQTVMHLHIHIIPRYDETDGIEIKFNENPNADLAAVLKEII